MIASVVTLGCKVNEYESQSILNQLKNAGYEIEEGLKPADVYVLNTCAVTNMAEHKSRQTITKILKINPNAKIVVCGCAAQNNPAQFLKNENVLAITGNFGKHNILAFLKNKNKVLPPLQTSYTKFDAPISTRARQYIKIQDGCNYFCTYCLIPYLRGRSVSRNLNDILEEIKNTNVNEIVLTGINMSDYRINNKPALNKLLQEVDKLNKRYRLSSLECNVIDNKFINTLKKSQNFCPHFHLSLQSACNQTLKRMNRHYSIEQFKETVVKLRKEFPTSCISTDIIVGFKGETDEEFNETLQNLKEIKFDFMHIFPYSIRSGTVAEKLSGDVDKKVVKNRLKILRQLNIECKTEFLNSNKNTTHSMLVELVENGYSLGYTENYIYTYLEGEFGVGEIVNVQLLKPLKDGMLAKIKTKK